MALEPEKMVLSWNLKIASFISANHDDISGQTVVLEMKQSTAIGNMK